MEANLDTKLKLDDLEGWTTPELVLLAKRALDILRERKEREAARDKSLGDLIKGKK